MRLELCTSSSLLLTGRGGCGECADLERLQDMDLRDVVMNEAWRGSEVMERCISRMADSLATPVAYDPDPR